MTEVGCKEVIENIYLWLDGELDRARCEELRLHVDGCTDCHGRYGIEHRFKEMLKERCCDEVPAALLERIQEVLRRETH